MSEKSNFALDERFEAIYPHCETCVKTILKAKRLALETYRMEEIEACHQKVFLVAKVHRSGISSPSESHRLFCPDI